MLSPVSYVASRAGGGGVGDILIKQKMIPGRDAERRRRYVFRPTEGVRTHLFNKYA